MSEPARPEDFVPPASESHGTPDKINAMLRASEAMRLRAMGLSWVKISERQGFADRSGSRLLVERYAADQLAETTELMRATWNETHRLQLAAAAAIMGDPDASPLVKLRANDTITRIASASRQLNGLNAPIKIEVSDAARAMVEQALSLLEDTVLGEVTAVTDEPADEDEAEDE